MINKFSNLRGRVRFRVRVRVRAKVRVRVRVTCRVPVRMMTMPMVIHTAGVRGANGLEICSQGQG